MKGRSNSNEILGQSYRHYLEGRAVSAGTILQLRTDDGWIDGRYEWSYQPDSTPFLVIDTDADKALTLTSDSLLRWPG